jgi:aspartate aminotransferase
MQLVTEQIRKSMEGSSWIRKMFEKGLELKTRYGADAVCDFSLGNPDVPPPAATREALESIAADAVKPLGLGYCPNAGIPAVREAMAQYINRQQGMQDAAVRCGANHVVMTVGAAGALVAFFRAVVEPGDEVVCPAPYFVEYASYCGHFGGVLKTVPSKSDDFSPDIEGLAAAITPKTRALLVNSPNNPTGAIYSAETMAKIAKLVDDVNAERGDSGRPLDGGYHRAGHRRDGDGQTAGPDPQADRGGNPRLRPDHLQRQDRHADPEQNDGRSGVYG